MQAPKTELVYSLPLNRLFDRDFDTRNLSVLKELTEPFRVLYDRNASRSLRIIREISGFRWKRVFIPIYVVKSCPESISDPLVLRYHENPYFMYALLIHELVHANLQGNVKLGDREKLEVCVNAVVMEVLKQSSDAEKLLEAAKHERNWIRMLKSRVHLKDETLAVFLKREK